MFSPVKEYALTENIPVYQPLKARDGEAMALVESLAPELIVVAAYGKILPEELLNYPKYGSINVHSSLLPKYRGAAPINWAILNGETETGVSIMYMAKDLDAGDVIRQAVTPIGDDEDAQALTARLADLGAETLSQVIRDMEAGKVSRTPQDHSAQTYAPMLSKELSAVDWSRSAHAIHCQIPGPDPLALRLYGYHLRAAHEALCRQGDRGGDHCRSRPGDPGRQAGNLRGLRRWESAVPDRASGPRRQAHERHQLSGRTSYFTWR